MPGPRPQAPAGANVDVKVDPNSQRLQLLTPFKPWDGKDVEVSAGAAVAVGVPRAVGLAVPPCLLSRRCLTCLLVVLPASYCAPPLA